MPRLIAYQLDDQPLPPIRPGVVRRDWMDATPQGFAYRCLPMTIANGHGWEILSQCGFEAWWDGGPGCDAISIRMTKDGPGAPLSHFGAGILTFPIATLLRSEPGQGLWVGGPPNAPKDGIAPLTGLVETDWSPMGFTMNWRFTRAHQVVRFSPGEAICFFFPLPLALAAETEPATLPIAADPALAAAHAEWREGRSRFNAALRQSGSAARAQGWQRDYHRGEGPQGQRAAAHVTRVRLRPFPPPPPAS